MGYSFQLASRVLLYALSYRQDMGVLCYTSQEREITQWVHHEGSIRRPITPLSALYHLVPPVGKRRKEGRKEMFYLTTHSTHFIYGYMASDIWLRTILIVRKETRCRHICYSFRLAARVLLYVSTHFIYGYMASANQPVKIFNMNLIPDVNQEFVSQFDLPIWKNTKNKQAIY